MNSNDDYIKAKAAKRLLAEVQKGWDSATESGWLSYAEVKEQQGIDTLSALLSKKHIFCCNI